MSGRPANECLHLYPALMVPLRDPRSAPNVIVFDAGDNDVNQGRNAAATYAAFTDYVAVAHRDG
jgi:hypothetical protein